MTNEAAQAGEREALLNQAAGIAMGGWHSVETARAFAAKVIDYILSQGAALPAVQPAESGEVCSSCKGSGIGSTAIGGEHDGGQSTTWVDSECSDCHGTGAALSQPATEARRVTAEEDAVLRSATLAASKVVARGRLAATTETGDGVLNKAQVCAALANAGLMLVKTEHGLRVEKAVTGTTAYSVSATPVAAVAQPVADEPEEAAEQAWRRLALQFDGHRMQAIGLLKLIAHTLKGDKDFAVPLIEKDIEKFLSAGPLSGEKVLAERIAALAASPSSERQDVGGDGAITDREEKLIARIRAQCDHAGINDMCLPARFGQLEGRVAVPEDNIEATIEGWKREHGLPVNDTKDTTK